MPHIAKFNYSDYSLLDSLYAKTGSIPTYSAISDEIYSIIPFYMPSETIIAKYLNSWLSLRGLDSNSAVQTTQKISGERSSLVQQFQNIISELETVEKNVTTLEQRNKQLELQNQRLLKEVEDFQKAIEDIVLFVEQYDPDVGQIYYCLLDICSCLALASAKPTIEPIEPVVTPNVEKQTIKNEG